MFKSATIRLYPNAEQQRQLWKMVDAYRFAFNWLLHMRKFLYEGGKVSLGIYSWYKWIPFLLAKFKWLDCLTVDMLRRSFDQVEAGYQRFFRTGKGYPKFKRKGRCKDSFTFTVIRKASPNGLLIPGLKHPIKAVWHAEIDAKSIKQITITHTSSGKWIASVTYKFTPAPKPAAKFPRVGLDFGLTTLVTPSHGKALKNPKYFVQNANRLAKLQRGLKRKQPGSVGYRRRQLRIAKLHERISSSRKFSINHWVFNTLSKNQAIVIEDLAVRNMMQNTRLSKGIGDAGWGYLRLRLEQKAAEFDRELIVADRFFPSSKLCKCGFVYRELSLSERSWRCPHCGRLNHRDRNAARNLESWPSGHPRWGAPGTRAERVRSGPSFESSVASPAVTPEGADGPAKKRVVSK